MILWICCKSLTAMWPQEAACCMWEMFIADTMVIIMDMFWPFDVKPKQKIEDCETLAKAFHLAFSYIESCCKVMWFRHVKHGDPATF